MVDVCTSDGDRCRIHERRILDLGLAVGAALDPHDLALLQRYAHADAAELRMVRLIARRGRSRAEVLERLAALGLDEDDAGDIVARFERTGLIDDDALVDEVVERTRRRGHGQLRVEHDLTRLQVEAVVATAPGDEQERACAAVIKRYGAIPDSPADLARASAFLHRRGFTEETILTALHLDL
jgi:regulatory protein